MKTAVDGGIIIVCLLLFLQLVTWAQVQNTDAIIAFHRAETKAAMSMLADCMNNKAILDRNTNIAYFCGKIIEVKL